MMYHMEEELFLLELSSTSIQNFYSFVIIVYFPVLVSILILLAEFYFASVMDFL